MGGSQSTSTTPKLETVYVPIDLITRNPEHPRKTFPEDALQQLADSFLDQGILQPLLLRKLPSKHYQIVIGERRWRAACLAGLDVVPAIVQECSDEEALLKSLSENVVREQLSVFEEGEGFARLINQYGFTHQGVADRIKKSRSYVTNRVRLLEINDIIKLHYDCGLLEAAHLIVLCGIPEEFRVHEAREAIRKGLSSKALEELARRRYNRTNIASRPKGDPTIERLARRLQEVTGCRVNIQHSAGGQGKVEFNYFSLEELEGFLERFDVSENLTS